MKPYVFCAALACTAIIAHAQQTMPSDEFEKAAIDVTWQPVPRWLPTGGAPLSSDLSLDPAFGNNGHLIVDGNTGTDREDRALRLRKLGSDYYALGKHRNSDGTWAATIARINHLTGDVTKKWSVDTPLLQINDASEIVLLGTDPRAYFVGTAHTGAFTDLDYAVTCVTFDPSAGATTCPGFGSSGTRRIAFDLGGSKTDVATRVAVVGPRLLVAGYADSPLTAGMGANYKLAVVSLAPDSGSTETGWGVGGKFVQTLYTPENGADLNVYAMAASLDSTRVYLAGIYKYSEDGNDWDGYVLAINPASGVLDTTYAFDGIRRISLDLCGATGWNCRDAVTAIAPLANGQLAFAGWSVDENAHDRLMLGRLNADGQFDPYFCGSGLCSKSPADGDSSYVIPYAIAERSGPGQSRDLIIAQEVESESPGGSTRYQFIEQYSASGLTRHYSVIDQYPFNDGSGGWNAPADILVDGGSAMVLGTRRWSDGLGDFDGTVSKFESLDTIFADGMRDNAD